MIKTQALKYNHHYFLHKAITTPFPVFNLMTLSGSFTPESSEASLFFP